MSTAWNQQSRWPSGSSGARGQGAQRRPAAAGVEGREEMGGGAAKSGKLEGLGQPPDGLLEGLTLPRVGQDAIGIQALGRKPHLGAHAGVTWGARVPYPSPD